MNGRAAGPGARVLTRASNRLDFSLPALAQSDLDAVDALDVRRTERGRRGADRGADVKRARNRSLLAASLLSILLPGLLGCARSVQDPLVGTWTMPTTVRLKGHDAPATAIAHFHPDGTLRVRIHAPGVGDVVDRPGHWKLRPDGKTYEGARDDSCLEFEWRIQGNELGPPGGSRQVWRRRGWMPWPLWLNEPPRVSPTSNQRIDTDKPAP